MENINNKINNFISHFHNQLQAILEIESSSNSRLYKKILLNLLLDALSRVTSNSNKENRKRFVSFISNFSEWKYLNNVSLPHLLKLLENVTDPEFSKLREFVYSTYSTWPKGAVITIDKDPPYEEVKKLWPSGFGATINNIKIEFLQHKYLFYEYRNILVHEFREPGHGIEYEDDTEAFYHSANLDMKKETWELVYPLGFYTKICDNCINNLKNYLIKEKINPYSQYSYGSYWIENLNL